MVLMLKSKYKNMINDIVDIINEKNNWTKITNENYNEYLEIDKNCLWISKVCIHNKQLTELVRNYDCSFMRDGLLIDLN